MPKVRLAKVAVENTAYHFDKDYDYLVPNSLEESAMPGCRVLVPFGGGNRKRQGMILSVYEGDASDKLKSITAVLDKAPLLTAEMLKLALWIKERYFCTLFDAVRVMLPAGINMRVVALYHLAPQVAQEQLDALSEEERRAYRLVAKHQEGLRRDKLLSQLGLTEESSLPDRLVRQGIFQKSEGAFRRIGDATIRMVRLLSAELDDEQRGKLSKKQKEVVDLLLMVGCASIKEICYFTGVTIAVLNTLQKKGIVLFYENEVYRNPYEGRDEEEERREIHLTTEQQAAYSSLYESYRSKKGAVSLLYGVTGSGKTSVFMKLIDAAAKEGKGVIVMVPEISLTPQMLALFKARYGDKVAVFHSALSMGERLDEWKRVKNGEATIAIGTRSAVFAPFEKLGLIIMDEEQEYTYKSEMAPRFHARDVAKFRCNEHNCLLVLSSATPSVESYYAAKTGRYGLCTLRERYGGAKLPKVTVVDMNEEDPQISQSVFSETLFQKLLVTIEQKKQAILLLNRRGYHTFATCRSCGETVTCPHCSISLTYHSANDRLLCHYCGYSIPFTEKCPHCHEYGIRFTGIGTQKIEQKLSECLPNARILRMDADTTMSKFSHETKLKLFSEGEYDIMIGTQMVAKGLDFKNVTLVGVLSADQALYSDDFRSFERAFALLTQVVGRSGRGEYKGEAVIQTYTPENPVIKLAANQDYESFFESEIVMRKAMLYPPFADLCVVGFVGRDERLTMEAARAFFIHLRETAQKEHKSLPLRILSASPACISRISNKYRYKVIIKFKNCREFREMLSSLLADFGRDRRFSEVSVFADVNPDMIL